MYSSSSHFNVIVCAIEIFFSFEIIKFPFHSCQEENEREHTQHVFVVDSGVESRKLTRDYLRFSHRDAILLHMIAITW